MPHKIIIYSIITAFVTALIGAAAYFIVFGGVFPFVGEKVEITSRSVLPKPLVTKEEELPVTPEPEPKEEVLPPKPEPEPKEEVLPPKREPEPKEEVLPPKPEPVVPPQPAKPKLHTVSVGDDYFNPRVINITVGDTVRWVNNGTKLHWPSADPHPTHSALIEFDPLSDLSPGENYAFTFTQVGAVPYHDHTQAIIEDVATVTGLVIVVAPK